MSDDTIQTTTQASGGESKPYDPDKKVFTDPTITKVDSTPKEIGMGKVTGARDGQTTHYKQGDTSFLHPRK